MNIQIIYYGTKKDYGKEYNYDFSSLNCPKTLDNYKINLIDLSSPELWKYSFNNYIGSNSELLINSISDFKSLKLLLEQSRLSKNIILFPQNNIYYWNYSNYSRAYSRKAALKDLIQPMIKLLQLYLLPNNFKGLSNLLYENSITKCFNTEYKASFSFLKAQSSLTKCSGSNEATTICDNNCIITSLDLNNHIHDFLKAIKLDRQEEDVPGWVKDYCFYNDEEQKKIIDDNNEEIKLLEKQNVDANEQLRINEHYKSILFSSGDCLVSVVFEILEKILSCDLSTFKDEKKEDFLIKKDDITFIGEIKGINSNVKNENVSQLEVHSQCYFDKLNEEGKTESVKALLIINPFRAKPISERDPVHETQIKLAERYGSLIITTEQILKIFEKFLFGDLKSEQIIERFKKEIGLFTL